MPKQELIDYIKRQQSFGHDVATIKGHLLKHGYTPEAADEAIQTLGAPVPEIPKKEKKLGKELTIAFVVLLILTGIGFAVYYAAFSNSTLVGSATEAAESADSTTPPAPPQTQEQKAEEAPPVEEQSQEPQEEPVEEAVAGEGTVSEEAPQETASEVIAAVPVTTGCSTDSDCESSSVCYNQICDIDNDHDGLSDTEEQAKGTDPHDQDSDDDGFFDADEAALQSNPLDEASPGYTSCIKSTDCSSGSGCNADGVCVACKDSDELNYKRRVTTQGTHYSTSKSLIAQDSCDASGYLFEYYCRTDGYLFYEKINCEQEYGEGYYCDEGKCKKV